MVKAKRFNTQGEMIGEVELPLSVFDVDVNSPKVLLHEVITMYLGNQRQGTVQKKNRASAQGSTRKLYKQKGTGNARAGSRRSPIRVGGGMAFAIYPKNWRREIPRNKKRMALKVALTDRAREGRIFVIENLKFDQASTKQAKQIIGKVSPERGRVLLVTDGHHVPTVKSFSNLPDVMTDRADSLHAYEVLKSSYIILSDDALKKVEEVFSK
ncbi:MAG: 50S ribosomal protein L4 [Candidatus Cloacimonadaceae bacterium]|jgi:large subunit ribosomal protein L4|nr:50S ribosomal protein L4 [Candidatus Cloacimonadota bacterium]MCK9177944.1 50S ribosomal protein L4 [Candidatus Cloacimonadota bacterium]MDD3532753.1 50S ribosomal protein L4 [Candidatus Cloacimonadota bacterium]MDY0127487.1 50S ribosomal protein L4 [Candidatus Cloacimonadaceae bacterium]